MNPHTATKKHLILLTNHFPYGKGESFLENEINWLVDGFDQVVVITKEIETKDCRFSAPNFTSIQVNPISTKGEKIESVFLFLKNFSLALWCLYQEVLNLKSIRKKISIRVIKKAFHDLFKALVLAKQIEKTIISKQLSGTVLVYSYWFTSSALATIFVAPKSISVKRIARAHGSDLNPTLHADQYLAFRKIIASKLDKVYSVSDFGANILNELIGQKLSAKIEIAKLGTVMPTTLPTRIKDQGFLLVSCSNLIPLKRIHLIIEALSLLNDLQIHWIHFGDGPLQGELEELASQHLNHDKYEFRGYIKNADLMKFYEQNFVDLFINTSMSEGLPVSLMEAQSFGIPCLATDVGGSREIVSKVTGKLLSKEITPLEISNSIRELLLLSSDQKEVLRKNCISNWREHFNAETNFSNFTNKILNP